MAVLQYERTDVVADSAERWLTLAGTFSSPLVRQVNSHAAGWLTRAAMWWVCCRSEDDADRKALARAKEQIARLESQLGQLKVRQGRGRLKY